MEKLREIYEDFKGIVLSLIICLLFLMAFLFKNLTHQQPENDWRIASTSMLGYEDEEESTIEDTLEENFIYVDIKGQINHPGVYQLDRGSRLYDLIEIAGGLKENANSMLINQAMILSDQMLVIVPSIEEGEAGNDIIPTVIEPHQNSPHQRININRATVDDLLKIQGIGPKKAQAIIDYRESNGSFQSIEEITNVKGIGEKTLQLITDQITVK